MITPNKPQPSAQSTQRQPVKKTYRRPSVQVYGTLSEVTGATTVSGRASDGGPTPPNNPANNRT